MSFRLRSQCLTNCLRCRARTQPESAIPLFFAPIRTESMPEDQVPPNSRRPHFTDCRKCCATASVNTNTKAQSLDYFKKVFNKIN
jgi:hypothetical protein